MGTIESTNCSDFGMTCGKCGNALIAPDWSEYVSDGLVLNFWSCWKCGYRFETETYMPADAELMNDRIAMEAFFPSLLVA